MTASLLIPFLDYYRKKSLNTFSLEYPSTYLYFKSSHLSCFLRLLKHWLPFSLIFNTKERGIIRIKPSSPMCEWEWFLSTTSKLSPWNKQFFYNKKRNLAESLSLTPSSIYLELCSSQAFHFIWSSQPPPPSEGLYCNMKVVLSGLSPE